MHRTRNPEMTGSPQRVGNRYCEGCTPCACGGFVRSPALQEGSEACTPCACGGFVHHAKGACRGGVHPMGVWGIRSNGL